MSQKFERYDGEGRLLAGGSSFLRFERFDGEGRMVSATGTGGATKFQRFDADGNLVTATPAAPASVGFWSPDFIQ